jgi:hypothetical protein
MAHYRRAGELPAEPLPRAVLGLCDDAAVFPPGLASLSDAVPAHRGYERSWFSGLVGPLVLTASALPDLEPLLDRADRALPVSVTLPGGPGLLREVLAAASRMGVELRSVEVTVPDAMPVEAMLDEVGSALDGVVGVDVYVEVPRDARRPELLRALHGRYRAKFRTGGVRAELYPDEAELAAAVCAAVEAGVSFKATAGLHHALRNTDPRTGFEQHGFLNLLLATDAVVHGAAQRDAAALLAERDGEIVSELVRGLGDERARAARESFLSFGTCSVTDPLGELVSLGIVHEPTFAPEGTAP